MPGRDRRTAACPVVTILLLRLSAIWGQAAGQLAMLTGTTSRPGGGDFPVGSDRGGGYKPVVGPDVVPGDSQFGP